MQSGQVGTENPIHVLGFGPGIGVHTEVIKAGLKPLSQPDSQPVIVNIS